MLISFCVENYRSYREQQVMSLLAEDSDELSENTIKVDIPALKGRRILRAAAIYGANSSGKSNFIKAFGRLAALVRDSANENTSLRVWPFELDEEWAPRPTRFSATFLVDELLYIYELAVTSSRVHSEQLTAFAKTHPRVLFQRKVNDAGESEWHFSRPHFDRDSDLEKRTRKNCLYISVGAAWNHRVLGQIASFFAAADTIEPTYADLRSRIVEDWCVKDGEFRDWAADFLAGADTGIADIRANKVDIYESLPDEIKRTMSEENARRFHEHARLEVAHQAGGNRVVWWPMTDESDGTRQLLSLLHSWYHLLKKGGVVAIDELDDSLHPLISRRLLQLLSDKSFAPAGGQLIFTTHDTTLLDPTLLRRDQVFFTEKTREGATQLYSLLEYTPRKQEAIQKGYLGGRYGAIPFLGDFKYEPSQQKTAALKEVATSTSDRGQSA